MDLKQIHELIKIINKSNIGEISIEDKDGKVTIKQKRDERPITVAAPQQVYTVPEVQSVTLPQSSTPAVAPNPSTTASESQAEKSNNYLTIKSPMIGTFYRRPSPDKLNFVEIGTEIQPGKVVCIIEAMKLFNEIESEISGRIVKILLEDNNPVEFDQPLFLVEPI